MSHLRLITNEMITENKLTLIKNEDAPVSVFEQRNAHPKMSEKYAVACTADIIKQFEKAGFTWEAGLKIKSRTKTGFEKHSVLFYHNDVKFKDDSLNKEIIARPMIVNSFDGSSKIRTYGGIFRVVCKNGLVAGDLSHNFAFRHSKNNIMNLDKLVDDLIKCYSQDMNLLITSLKDTKIGMDEQLKFAEAFARERFKGSSAFIKADYEALVRSYRYADDEDSVWNVLNRIQENGGLNARKVLNPVSYWTLVDKNGSLEEKQKTMKKVSGLDSVVHLNSFLFEYAQNYLPQSVLKDLKKVA